MNPLHRRFALLALAAALALSGAGWASEDENSSLTSLAADTPAEGLELAIRLARQTVTTIQTDRDVLHEQRLEYAEDAAGLIAASEVAAAYFQTVAEANDFWRETGVCPKRE